MEPPLSNLNDCATDKTEDEDDTSADNNEELEKETRPEAVPKAGEEPLIKYIVKFVVVPNCNLSGQVYLLGNSVFTSRSFQMLA